MKKNSVWKMLFYIGTAVLAVVLLFVLKKTILDTYSTAEYNSLVTRVSGKVIGLLFAVAVLFCFLFCGAVRLELLGVGQALAAYAGLTISACSVFLPETVLDLKWIDVRLDHPDYVYETIRTAVLMTDALCVLGIFVLLVMILGSMNNEYKAKVKNAITGLGCVALVLSLASLGFKTFRFNGWVFFVAVFFVVLGCVILFLYWTKKQLQFSILDSIFDQIIAKSILDEDEWDDEDDLGFRETASDKEEDSSHEEDE